MAEPARSGRRDCVSRQTKRCIKFGSFVLLTLYIAVLIYVCFFSEDYGRDVITSYYRYNLIPFKEIRRFFNSFSLISPFSIKILGFPLMKFLNRSLLIEIVEINTWRKVRVKIPMAPLIRDASDASMGIAASSAIIKMTTS